MTPVAPFVTLVHSASDPCCKVKNNSNENCTETIHHYRMESLCLTCLSNVGTGVSIPPAIVDFLQNILRFRVNLRKHLIGLVCFSCYKTICEMKRFYLQLQDVAHYLDQSVEKELTQSVAGSTVVDCLTSTTKGVDTTRDRHNKCVDKDKTAAELYEQIGAELQVANVHESGIVSEGSYRCENCCRVFEKTDNFTRHVKWHISHGINTRKVQQEKKFKCPICGKRFRTSAEKRAHDVTHTNLRPFKCEICPKTFRQLSGLSVHRAVHFGKRVECPECGKRFATKFELTRHSNVHKKKRKNRIFPEVPGVQMEMETNAKPIDCTTNDISTSICDKIYGNVMTIGADGNLPSRLDDETVLLEEIVKEVQQSSVEITYGANGSLFEDGQANVFLNNGVNSEYIGYKEKP